MPKPKQPKTMSDSKTSPYEEELRVIGEVLQRDGDQIMERWFKRAHEEQAQVTANKRIDAMDDLREMLQSIGCILQEQSSRALEEAVQISREHGQQRAGLGWSIVNVVSDYELLHVVSLEHLGDVLDGRLSSRQATILATVIGRATGSAVKAFSEMVNRKLEDHVRAQQVELRQLTLDLTDAKHRERQDVAQTLHDDLQQTLVAARMKLEAGLRDSPPDLSAVKEASGLLSQILEVSRYVTADLHPTVLETESLPAALQWLGETFQKRYGLTVTVELPVEDEIEPGPMSLQRLVYDIVRELLFNVVKHGRTERAWVKMICDGKSSWTFEIKDRGVGSLSIERDDVPAGESRLGVASIRRRISKIGGKMEIDSKPGRGTRIALTVPLD